MTFQRLTAIVICVSLFACAAHAAPTLSVTSIGNNGSGNRDWLVEVAPDPSLFSGDPPGGSMAVELAFAIADTDLLGVDVNTDAWDMENPGYNPFMGTITEGLWLDLIGDRAFGAFGSIKFYSGDPVELFTIETAGLGLTTVRYGEAASGDPALGARIAQAGIDFDGYTGSVTVPEPASGVLTLTVLAMLAGWRRRA
jgi:hypothetical protein